jgi:hypothetical protein
MIPVTSTPRLLKPVASNIKNGNVRTSEVDSKLHHSTRNHSILHAIRSSKDEQLTFRIPFFVNTKSMNLKGG